MPRFALAYELKGSHEPATYYHIDGLGRTHRVGDPKGATTWGTEGEAHDAKKALGLSADPSVHVVQLSEDGG